MNSKQYRRQGKTVLFSLEVIGCAANGREAIEIARGNAPDIFLMDIQMPEMDGIEAAKYIAENNWGKVLISTTFDDELVAGVLKNSAKGYLVFRLPFYSTHCIMIL